MNAPFIRTFSAHYRSKYGETVGKIPLDLNIVCPNRVHGGCIFCRPASFTPQYLKQSDSLETQIKKAKKSLVRGRFVKFFAYFQQETVTAIDGDELLDYIKRALKDSDCLGIILSTRPDYISRSFLILLDSLILSTGKECLIELGLQSIHEKSLRLLNRNHSLQDFYNAYQLINSFDNLQTGAHILFGVPGESTQDMTQTVQYVCSLGIDALKLHHLQVIEDTPLHDMYVDGNVKLFSKVEYLNLLLKIIPIIPKEVVIHRLWTTSHPDILIAPKWNILPGELSRELYHRMNDLGIEQGCSLE